MIVGSEIFPDKNTPKKMVVFLHGYGAHGDDLLSLAYSWRHIMPTTLFFGPNGIENWEGDSGRGNSYQWFGLQDLDSFNLRNGLNQAGPIVADHIKQYMVKYQLSPQDVAFVGFSQGAMLALELMFFFPNLSAVVGFSGAFYPPNNPLITKPLTSVLLVHGVLDAVVPYFYMKQSERSLKACEISCQTYTCESLGHGIDTDGINKAGTFLHHNLYHKTKE